MKHLTLIAAGFSALIAAPALAGGVGEPAEPPVTVAPSAPMAPDNNWTGFSVGAQLGYGDVSTNAAGVGGDDALLGLRAYYDYDFGNFILGGGIQYDYADIDLGGGITADSVGRLGLRAGVDLGQNWLYGTAGFAQAQTSGGGIGDADGGSPCGTRCCVASITVGAEVLDLRDSTISERGSVDALTHHRWRSRGQTSLASDRTRNTGVNISGANPPLGGKAARGWPRTPAATSSWHISPPRPLPPGSSVSVVRRGARHKDTVAM